MTTMVLATTPMSVLSGKSGIVILVGLVAGIQFIVFILLYLRSHKNNTAHVAPPHVPDELRDDRLVAVLNAIQSAAALIDTEAGRITHLNRAARGLLVIGPRSPIDTLLARLTSDSRTVAEQCLREARLGEEMGADVELLLAAGVPMAAHLRARPLDPEQRSRLVVVTIEGARLDEVPEDSAELFFTLVEGVLDEVNAAFERVTGYKRDELRGQSITELLVPRKHRETVAELLSLRLCTKQLAATRRIPLIDRDGQVRPVDWRFMHSFDGQGRSVLAGTGREAFEATDPDNLPGFVHTALHRSPMAALILDTEGRVIDADPATITLLGDDLVAGSPPPFLSSRRDDLMPLRKMVEDGIRGAELDAELTSMPVRGAESGFYRVLTRTLRDHEGTRRGVALYVEDRTLERRAEIEAAREAKRQQRFLIDNLNGGSSSNKPVVQSDVLRFLMDNLSEMFVVVQDGRFTFASEGARKILGVSPHDLLGKRFEDFVAREHRDRANAILSPPEGTRGPLAKIHELPMVRADGTLLWTELRPQATTWHTRAALIGVITDITDRYEADRKLRFQATILDQMKDWVTVTDRSGQLRYVSPAMERLLGVSDGQFLGRTLHELGSALRTELPSMSMIAVSCEEGGSWQGRVELHAQNDGTVQADVTISPMIDHEGTAIGYIALGHDVTAQAALESQLLHGQKMDAIGQLAGGIAHDFNNILVAVKGYAQLASLDLDPDHAIQEDLQGVSDAADRAAQLTRQLLAFSRQEVTQPRPVDLWEVVTNFGRMLRRIIGESVDLEISEPADDLWTTVIDPGQAELVLMNLGVNARDAMPGGGTIGVTVGNEEVRGTEPRLLGKVPAGDYVVLTVSDQGTGIPEKYLSRVFDPFFTTKEVGKGTGLGLSTVYGIVKQCKGGIDVDSRQGEGTTFRLYFPASRLSAVSLRSAEHEMTEGNGELVLIAEDNLAVLQVAERTLRSFGYEVMTASSGAEVVELFARHQASVDLVILDVVMPGMSGRTAFDKIHAIRSDTPVLFCSGYSRGELQASFLEEHDLAFLPKPYSPADLLTNVREALESRAGVATGASDRTGNVVELPQKTRQDATACVG